MDMALVDTLMSTTGLSADRVRFLICMMSCYPLALVFSKVFHPSNVSTNVRHLFQLSVGLAFCYFCFKLQILLLLLDTGMCYLLMLLCPASIVHIAVFVWAITFMSVSHIYRMYTDYNGYTLDFTGPTMIITMKVTSLACSLFDGTHQPDEKLNPDQRLLAVKKVPSVIEYLSYMFCFTSILSGPTFNLHDYQNFIEGTEIKRALEEESSKGKEPSGMLPGMFKFFQALFFISFTFVLPLNFEPFFDEEWRNTHSVWYVFGYLYLVATLARCQYYFAWILADSVSNISGFGFNGYDSSGAEKWDKITNVYPMRTECSSSLKVLIENWNVGTALWLRRVCYERVSAAPTFMTYILSATWHGFYPGYYGCFISMSFYVMTSRKLRRFVRPYFLGSILTKQFYDLLTTVCSLILINFACIQLCVLSYERVMVFYKYWYVLPHIVCLILYLGCPAPTKRS